MYLMNENQLTDVIVSKRLSIYASFKDKQAEVRLIIGHVPNFYGQK